MSSDSERYVIVPGESELRYEVNEVLLREGNRLATAIGVTSLVSGEVLIDRRVPANSRIGPIEADISAFQSDAARRDNAIRERWLESATYPMVRFEPTDVTGAPATFSDGQDVSLTVTGNATVRDTTKPLTFEVSGTIQGDELRASGSATARMTDFNFPPPDILGVLKVDDEFRIVFDILARREG
jgi:polyisoprenoid-binding protein YceI